MTGSSFERFYYEKVALSEGCGCAEQIIGTRDLEARSRHAALERAAPDSSRRRAWLARLLRRLGRGRRAATAES